MVAAASVLAAAQDPTRQRFVTVVDRERVLAEAALLLEHPRHGLLLRLRDLRVPLPAGLPRIEPVRVHDQLYLPLAPLEPYIQLDRRPGVLAFGAAAGVVAAGPDGAPARGAAPGQPPPLPAPRPPLPDALRAEAGAEAGRTSELLWLGEGGVPPVFRPSPGPVRPPLEPDAPPEFRPLIEGDREAPGPVRRRDPLELPLLPEAEWQETLVSLVLNGALVSEGALFLQGPDGAFAARVLDLRAWRVRLDENRIITFNGEPYYPLDALPGAALRFDGATLTLALDLPPDLFEASELVSGRPSYLEPSVGQGAYFDYDLVMLGGDELRTRMDALLEVGAFDRMGVLLSNFRAGDVAGDEREFVRLDTTFTRDFPSRRTSLRVGDSLTAGGALGRPVRFGGLQWSSNFATDPSFIAFPLPSIGGLAEQPSTAEVILDNSRRVLENVPPGPFQIDNLPVVTGAGELQLRVTDLLGREQLITQSYYVSPRLLREGLSEFSYELGFEREDFNRESFAYDQPFGVGTHRYGLTDAITGEARLETGLERQALGLGGSFLLGSFGLVSAGVVGSHDDDAGAGYGGFLDYEYRGADFSVGLRSGYSDAGFRQLGSGDLPADRRVDQASLGFGLGHLGRVGALFINTEARVGRDRQVASANYSIPIGPGTLLLNGLQTLEPSDEFALIASYSLPIGQVRSLTTAATFREGATRGAVQYTRGRGSSDLGLSYRVATEVGDQPRLFDGSVRYDAEVASAELDVAHVEGDTTLRGNLSGSLAYLDGEMRASRRLGRAFGLVALPGHPDVTVYLENREVGRTDDEGYLLLPRLNPYQANRVRIRPEDLPLTAELDREEQIAVPYERGGVAIAFDVRTQRTALVTLVDGAGAPLPAGLVLAGRDGAVGAQVADAGLAYVRGTVGDASVLESVEGQPGFSCPLPALPDEPMAALGEVACERVRQ